MSELFPKLMSVRLPDNVVQANGGDRELIEKLKRRLDERMLGQMKEMLIRERMKRLSRP